MRRARWLFYIAVSWWLLASVCHVTEEAEADKSNYLHLRQLQAKSLVSSKHEQSIREDASMRASIIEDPHSSLRVGIDWDAQNKLPPWMTSITEGAEQAIAIVLGQSLKPDGSVPQVLMDRAHMAKELLDSGKVMKVVVSGGDPAGVGHTEASKAAEVLMSAGIPLDRIIQESQATTTAENAWFTLRWIPKGTGQIYIVTSDFHMARATYIFKEVFDFFYRMMEERYKDSPMWKSTTKRYPRLAIRQATTKSFCGRDASRSKDDDPAADVNTKSLGLRARDELRFLGTREVPEALFGEPLNKIMYIWPTQINVTEDPDNGANFNNALAQAMNAAAALCVCKAPPETGGPEIDYPLSIPISTTFPRGLTPEDWEAVADNSSCLQFRQLQPKTFLAAKTKQITRKDASVRASVIEDLRSTLKVGIDWDAQNKLPPWMTYITEGAEQAIAIVLGQSLKPDGSVPQVLMDRARMAKHLLDSGKVMKVVVSGGDPAGVGHTEASKAAEVLVSAGIPLDRIIQESQATTTAENAWFTLRWIPKGTGQIYIVTSDFHMARATYIFKEVFNYLYKMLEEHYKDSPMWKSSTKRYPRLAVRQATTKSFCSCDASRSKDDDPAADIDTKSLALRATSELRYLGTREVPEALFGEPLNKIMYIWPTQINVTEDPDNAANFNDAMAQAMNAAAALCVCKAPPETGGPEIDYPLSIPISTTFPKGLTPEDWEKLTHC